MLCTERALRKEKFMRSNERKATDLARLLPKIRWEPLLEFGEIYCKNGIERGG